VNSKVPVDPHAGRLRMLVISRAHLFPSEGRPTAGLFFANLVLRLERLVEKLVVVVPVAYMPDVLTRFSRFHLYRSARHERWHGVEVYRPRYFSLRLQRRGWFQARSFCLAAMPLCEALHKRHHFNLVLGNGLGGPVHTAQRSAKQFGCRSVGWAVGSDGHTYPHRSRSNMQQFRHDVTHTDLILTTSDALRRHILAANGGTGNVLTFYRGIDLGDVCPPGERVALRARHGLRPDRRYLLMAGVVNHAKGSQEFYEAFRRLAGTHPDLAAIWVGEGPDRLPLTQRARADGLGDRLTITGRVPRATVLEYMRAADVMLFPSRAEGLPNVVMEAMASGLPVVATDVGGVREIVLDGRTGLLVPAQDVPAMVAAVDRLLADNALAKDMARGAEALIRQHFDVDRNATVLASILEGLTAGAGPRPPIAACADVKPGRLPSVPAGP